ncbi:phage terminase large subunit [Nostoc sp. CHAB 5844]|nr:phage terminase large subunit [Nostoc sp. CHAB 5844]
MSLTELQIRALSELELRRRRNKVTLSLSEFVKKSWQIIEPSTELVWNWHIDAMCIHIQETLLDWHRRKLDPSYKQRIQNLVINVPPGSLKPVHNGSMINEKIKGRIPIAEVVPGDNLLTHKGRYRKVLAVHEQGVLPLLQITTWSGRILKLAKDHPLLTTRGWIEAQYITTQDVLANIHPVEDGGTNTISVEEARVLGYLIGDGYLSGNRAASFTNQDADAIQDFIHCTQEIGHTAKIVRKSGTAESPVCIVTMAEKEKFNTRRGVGKVRQWMRSHDLEGKNSYTKRVPAAVMGAKSDVIVEFLAAYWACDGGIQDRRDIPRAGRVGQLINAIRLDCCTVSEGLARDLQHLLNRLGLRFRLRRKEHKLQSKRQGSTYVSWGLFASDQDTVAKFMQVIAPSIKHEKSLRAQGTFRTQFDQVLNPDPVVSITEIDSGECRCLTVEEDESFTIEDIAVHNSRVLSVCAPAWMWTIEPSWRAIFLSANPRVATRDSVYCRDVIESDWYQKKFYPDWELRGDNNSKSSFWNTKGGVRSAFGFNSRITGDRADFIGWDDPHDAQEVLSDVIRQGVIDRWDSAIRNRVNDLKSSVRVGIMQRLHEQDLSGHVLKQGGWVHLCVPQEFEKAIAPTPLGWIDPRTEPGELMFPDRFPPEVLEAEKTALGSYGYAGQHQQRPAPADGGHFKRTWWKYYKVAPSDFDLIIQSWDCTFKETKKSDFVVGQVWGKRGSQFYLLDQVRDRMDINATIAAIRALSIKWPQTSAKLIEDKANGPAVISLLEREIPGLIAIEPEGGKLVRAVAIAPYVEAGNVFLPENAPWVGDYVTEFSTFPNGANDDMVDSTSQSLNWLQSRLGVWGEDTAVWG